VRYRAVSRQPDDKAPTGGSCVPSGSPALSITEAYRGTEALGGRDR
jgi:hypothetical protein